jgi:hypothetical protein
MRGVQVRIDYLVRRAEPVSRLTRGAIALRTAIMKSVTYFADLSACSYALNGRDDDLVGQPDAVNIGWLGAGHEFPVGQAPGWLVPGILKLVTGGLVNLMRGYHVCHMVSAKVASAMQPLPGGLAQVHARLGRR